MLVVKKEEFLSRVQIVVLSIVNVGEYAKRHRNYVGARETGSTTWTHVTIGHVSRSMDRRVETGERAIDAS